MVNEFYALMGRMRYITRWGGAAARKTSTIFDILLTSSYLCAHKYNTLSLRIQQSPNY